MRLLEAVRVHKSLVLDFECFMTDRLGSIHDAGLRMNCHKRVRLESSDREAFDMMIRELDGLFAKTDEMLRAWGLESAEENWGQPSEAWIHDTDSTFFRLRGKITLPINYYNDLCKYRWHAAQLLHRQEGREMYEEAEDPNTCNNTLAYKFRVTAPLSSGEKAAALQRIVVRRYQGSGRTVLVWRIFSEEEGEFSGMYYSDETGWGVATPTQSDTQEGTVLRSCVRIVAQHLNSSGTTVTQFNDKLLEWGLENNTETTIGLEKLEIKSSRRVGIVVNRVHRRTRKLLMYRHA